MQILIPLLIAAPAVVCPKLDQAPQLDGRLNESVWKEAAQVEGFVNFQPVEGEAPSQKTRAYVYRDEHYLYVGIEARDTDPSKIRANVSHRDAIFDDDFVAVIIDPFADHQKGFMLFANPLGIQADGTRAENQLESEDMNWDTVFESAGKVGEDGYTVELAIPFESLRYPVGNDSWGIALVRYIPRTSERMSWPPLSADRGPLLNQSGRLTGMSGVRPPTTVELIPEVTVAGSDGLEADRGLFQVADSRAAVDAGGTARFALGGSTRMGLTVNPDFSQVESDEARITVNQRFALFYSEKRPFFLEGRNLLKTPWQVIYTRSIVDPAYGARLTGKWGNTSLAALHAMDVSPAPSTIDDRWTADAYGSDPAFTTLVRSTTDVTGHTTLGVLAVDKRIGDTMDNRLGGLDFNVRLNDTWRLVNQTLFSATDHPDGNVASGHAFKTRLLRFGRHFSWFSWYEELSPGFRAEAGFIPRVGYRETGVRTSYRFETGNPHVIAITPNVEGRYFDSVKNSDRERQLETSVTLQFPTGAATLGGQTGRFKFADRWFPIERASGDFLLKPYGWLSFYGSTSVGKEIFYDPADPFAGTSVAASGGFALNPSARLSLSLDYNRNWLRRHADQDVFDASVMRASASWFASRALGFRLIGDLSNLTDELTLDALLTYQPRPATLFFLGYREGIAVGPSADTQGDRALFLKASYLWQLRR